MGILLLPPSISLSFVCPSRYLLLNHWADFYQTCNITSPHGRVCESNISFLCVRPSDVHPFVCHTIASKTAEFNQSCYISSRHVKVVREQYFFHAFVRPSLRHAISSSTTGLNSNKLAISLPLMVSVCESIIIFPCVGRPSICPSRYLLLNQQAEFSQICCITFPHE